MGKWKYGVILDAGSSGTRIHIYQWLNSAMARKDAGEKDLRSLPEVTTDKKWTKKTHPGVSTFGENPTRVGPDHLASLFEHALKYIPKEDVEDTPIFLLATAGMRLLPAVQRNALLQNICSYARENTKFQLPDCDLHIQVIPGETEGLYGWIAANYLLGGFNNPEDHDHGKGHHTYGFLDMGGASAQIAFAPNETEAERHANDLKLLRMRTLNGEDMDYRVFVTTWLGFGMNEARRRYVQQLMDSSPKALELPDPCLPSGLTVSLEGEPITADDTTPASKYPHLLGIGDFPQCLHSTFPLLDKDKPCPDTPCLFQGVHVPAIDFDVNHFVGVSEYWHTTHEVFEMDHKNKAYDFHTYQSRVQEFCSQDWEEIQKGVGKKKWGKKVDEKTAEEVCFKASWLISMLHDGIGVPRIGLEPMKTDHNGTKEVIDKAKSKGFLDPFQAIHKIDDVEVSWTLGKMVLYASSQIPPAETALEVGFGSNEKGVLQPTNFQPAGGTFVPAELEDPDDWADLFDDSPRRIPGFLLFVAILLLAAFLVCGKARRTSLYHKFLSLIGRPRTRFGSPRSSPRKRRGPIGQGLSGLGIKLFGNPSGPSYERVLESGEAAEFELGDANSLGLNDSDNEHSDSSEGSGSRVGRTSGWATPQMKGGFDGLTPATPGYFDQPSHTSQGAGLGFHPPNAFAGREGLMSRTESRERLGGTPQLRGGAGTPGLRGGVWSGASLAPGGGYGIGTGSRPGSPVRIRSPMLCPPKESVD